MAKYYSIQRTIQLAYPIGRDFGFRKTYRADGLEWTQPHTSFVGGVVKCENQMDALNHISEVWEKMKTAYERDGWTAYQKDTESADIIFVSPQGVLNIYTDWTLAYQS